MIPLLHTATSERFRGASRDEALYKSTFTLLYFTYLVLILVDLLDGSVNAELVQSGEQSHDDDAGLVAEHCPAEMCQSIEDHEADDAEQEVEDTDGQQQPHPSPDGSKVWLVERVEVLQTLDGHLYLDVAHPRVDHSQDNDEQRDDRLDDRVCQMSRFIDLFVVPHVQRFLDVRIINNRGSDFR